MLGTIELSGGSRGGSRGSNLVVLAEVRSVTSIFYNGNNSQYSFFVGFRNIDAGLTLGGFDSFEAAETVQRALLDALSKYFVQHSPAA